MAKGKSKSKGKEKTSKKEHPGFLAVQKRIAKENGGSMKEAGAILASATRRASKKAKQKNPKLRKVK